MKSTITHKGNFSGVWDNPVRMSRQVYQCGRVKDHIPRVQVDFMVSHRSTYDGKVPPWALEPWGFYGTPIAEVRL
jgi:hypothetical protein